MNTNHIFYTAIFFIAVLTLFSACKKEENNTTTTETKPQYSNAPYVLEHAGLPAPKIPADNKLTLEGVKLGRMLFYEKSMSKDGSQSCASCHQQVDAFTDIRKFSIGVEKKPGKRQAMAIFNMAWHKPGFFWDGRAEKLREQALMPIQDPLEMNETLPNVINKLKVQKRYTDQFIRAFGDENITEKRLGLALEQFMMSIVSNNSKYDLSLVGKAQLTASEKRGKELFFKEYDPVNKIAGGECFHCHAGPNFTNSKFMNNGLDAEADFKDLGRFDVTKKASDKAKFKVTSLRNIALTPPYMHDGRFKTLEEVIEHYNTGVKKSSTVDHLLQYNLNPGLKLSPQDVKDLVAFLHTLTDESLKTNEKYTELVQ